MDALVSCFQLCMLASTHCKGEQLLHTNSSKCYNLCFTAVVTSATQNTLGAGAASVGIYVAQLTQLGMLFSLGSLTLAFFLGIVTGALIILFIFATSPTVVLARNHLGGCMRCVCWWFRLICAISRYFIFRCHCLCFLRNPKYRYGQSFQDERSHERQRQMELEDLTSHGRHLCPRF